MYSPDGFIAPQRCTIPDKKENIQHLRMIYLTLLTMAGDLAAELRTAANVQCTVSSQLTHSPSNLATNTHQLNVMLLAGIFLPIFMSLGMSSTPLYVWSWIQAGCKLSHNELESSLKHRLYLTLHIWSTLTTLTCSKFFTSTLIGISIAIYSQQRPDLLLSDSVLCLPHPSN